MSERNMLKSCVVVLLIFLCPIISSAQEDLQAFKNYQLSFPKVSKAWTHCSDTLKQMFEKRGLTFPPHQVFIRSFKSSNDMELWARNDDSSEYIMVKNYRICALSGFLGPKRLEGDRQVPEGFYFIDEFNPQSEYYMSLLINYPNYSDQHLSDKHRPGGDIYIHGGCVTVGCIPMTDELIQELYIICMSAKANGQTNIPVHIFPARFDRGGMNLMSKYMKGDPAKQSFWSNLKGAYDYFEHTHQLMPVMYDKEGRYITN
jgi:murein L,D-transpeptidase YafK